MVPLRAYPPAFSCSKLLQELEFGLGLVAEQQHEGGSIRMSNTDASSE